ncbi:hypothetical protein [Chitinophaga terrae (ex Kim and Jung 2007)]|nr:hypothetical protein [Chitinophaga terrae (ex Kim and Jung 2007)]
MKVLAPEEPNHTKSEIMDLLAGQVFSMSAITLYLEPQDCLEIR